MTWPVKFGGRHSTEVVLVLLTQPPRVEIPPLLRFFLLSIAQFIDRIERSNPCSTKQGSANPKKELHGLLNLNSDLSHFQETAWTTSCSHALRNKRSSPRFHFVFLMLQCKSCFIFQCLPENVVQLIKDKKTLHFFKLTMIQRIVIFQAFPQNYNFQNFRIFSCCRETFGKSPDLPTPNFSKSQYLQIKPASPRQDKKELCFFYFTVSLQSCSNLKYNQ